MGSTNFGNQLVEFKYSHPATASEFNKYLGKLIKFGIYEGCSLSIISGTQIRIATGLMVFECSSGELVRVQTQSVIDLTGNEATPYITANFVWENSANIYADFAVKSLAQLYSNDIIFGKAIYVGGVLTSIDLTQRTYGLINQEGDVIVSRDLIVKRNVIQSSGINGNPKLIQSANLTADNNYSSICPITIQEGSIIEIEEGAVWMLLG